MIKINGNDVFKDNKFDWYSWSADVLQSPAELREAFDKLNLIGKRIVDLLAIGDEFSGADYDGSGKSHILSVSSWQPFIFVFDDGDRLEIDFSEMTSVRMSMNCFPPELEDIEPLPDIIDGKRFIAPCMGSKIIGMDICVWDECPGFRFTGSYDITLNPNQENYIGNFDLLLDNGLKIRFEAHFDDGYIYIFDANGNSVWTTSIWDNEREATGK